MGTLQSYHWPGNIRELQNVIERAVIMTQGHILQLQEHFRDVLPSGQEPDNSSQEDITDLKELEYQHILKIVQRCNWKIYGDDGAARLLGLHPNTLRSRMKKLDLVRPE